MNVVEHRTPLKRIDLAAKRPVEIVAVVEDDHARGARLVHEANIWDALTATAQASQQGEQ